MIRFATEQDDLSHLLSEEAQAYLDPSSILVYDQDGIQGLIVLIQNTHRILWVESLICTRPFVTRSLLRHVVKFAKSRGYRAIVGWSNSRSLRALAAHQGAQLDKQRITYTLRDYARSIYESQNAEG